MKSTQIRTPPQKVPSLTLVGAGPGDPELITLKGIKALRQADAILYDALANEELLAYAPATAPRVYVGKRAGQHKVKQEQINQMIVQYAYQYGHVVRLKGGDPYVFGRGHEEQHYAEQAGVSTQVIPGISSAYAVPVLQHIPLTKRSVSESFWVITGTTRTGQLSGDIALAAQSTATVVILMGMSKLASIQAVFAQHGKSNTPVAIIQNGSLPEERIAICQVHNMVATAAEQGLGAPAIIVMGEVVNERKSIFLTNKITEHGQYAHA